MSRLSTITKNPKRKVAGLTVALAALGVAVGSGASFTSESSESSAVFSAGLLHHDTTEGGAMASATVTQILPGFGTDLLDAAGDPAPEGPDTDAPGTDSHGTLTVENDGDVAGVFSVATTSTGAAYSGLLDVCDATCEPLDDALRLHVTSTDTDENGAVGSPTVEYDGTVADFDGAGLSGFTLEPDASRTYDAYFWLPAATGNDYQGGSASIGIDIDEAQQP